MVNCHALICYCTFLTLIITSVVKSDECPKVKCPGPLAHYRSLRCMPIYKYNKCCAWQYNCDSLYKKARSRTKCYFNGRGYEIGEKIMGEDATVCERDCTCAYTGGGFADFNCTDHAKLCPPYKPSRDGCYQIKSLVQCCSTEEYCPQSGEKRRTVSIYENTYPVGDYFISEHRPNYICVASPTGPLNCSRLDRWYLADIHAEAGFNKKCAPVYLLINETVTELRRHSWRCQAANDTVIDIKYPNPEESKHVHGPLTAMHCPRLLAFGSKPDCVEPFDSCRLINPDGPPEVTYDFTYKELCQFGQMTMHIGDELNSIEYDVDSCIVCACEVPPVPTCILLQNVTCQQSSAQKTSLFNRRNILDLEKTQFIF